MLKSGVLLEQRPQMTEVLKLEIFMKMTKEPMPDIAEL